MLMSSLSFEFGYVLEGLDRIHGCTNTWYEAHAGLNDIVLDLFLSSGFPSLLSRSLSGFLEFCHLTMHDLLTLYNLSNGPNRVEEAGI